MKIAELYEKYAKKFGWELKYDFDFHHEYVWCNMKNGMKLTDIKHVIRVIMETERGFQPTCYEVWGNLKVCALFERVCKHPDCGGRKNKKPCPVMIEYDRYCAQFDETDGVFCGLIDDVCYSSGCKFCAAIEDECILYNVPNFEIDTDPFGVGENK